MDTLICFCHWGYTNPLTIFQKVLLAGCIRLVVIFKEELVITQ